MIKRIFSAAAMIGTLASCAMETTPEQSAEIERKYRPVVNAALPACIASASGRKADYAQLFALGYQRRAPAFGAGDYLYPQGKSMLFGGDEGIRFVPGEGCYAGHDGLVGVAMGGMSEIGQVWIRALEQAGYQDTDGSPSTFSFTANGVPMTFRGSWSSDSGIQFRVQRTN